MAKKIDVSSESHDKNDKLYNNIISSFQITNFATLPRSKKTSKKKVA